MTDGHSPFLNSILWKDTNDQYERAEEVKLVMYLKNNPHSHSRVDYRMELLIYSDYSVYNYDSGP